MARRTMKNYPRDIEMKLDKMSQELRQNVRRIEDPKGQVLFETAAEVLTGLRTAFQHYESDAEQVWK